MGVDYAASKRSGLFVAVCICCGMENCILPPVPDQRGFASHWPCSLFCCCCMQVKSIEQQRTRLYRQMTQLRKDLHTQALQRQQQLTSARQQPGPIPEGSPACQELRQEMCELFGTPDDAVAYLGFHFALQKALDKTAAVAKVVLEDRCRSRNSTLSALV